MMFIYKITNSVNGKIYIGKTTKANIKVRWAQHVWEAGRDKRWPLQSAIRKYGVSNFTIETICEVGAESELNDRERFYIAQYRSTDPEVGYNLTPGGDGVSWWKGRQRSPESIAKQVATRRTRGAYLIPNNSPEVIAKRTAARRAKGNYKERVGLKHTVDTIEKMRLSAKHRAAKKQEQVKELYKSGLSHSAIAGQLGMSLKFVRKHTP